MSGWRVRGDWGTTRLRLWRVVAGEVVDRVDGPGIGTPGISPAVALRDALAAWRAEHGAPARITLCGMAGARNGLHEVAYAECPTGVDEWRGVAANLSFEGVPLTIAAGCATADDVMRGEETQVFGAVAAGLAQRNGAVVLPGTHSKWVALADGRITGLRSFLTGELFALLRQSSLFATGDVRAEPADGEGFAAGLALAQQSPGVLGHLFGTRVAQLRHGRTAGWAREMLSGLLIGGEMAEMRAAGAMPASIALIGETALAQRYAEAIRAFGATATLLPGDACVLAGLELLDADD